MKKYRILLAMLGATIAALLLCVFAFTAEAGGGLPSTKLGCQKTGPDSWSCDIQAASKTPDSGSWQTVYTLTTPLASFQTHEQMDVTALVRFRIAPGGDASTMGGVQLVRLDGQYENGAFTDFATGSGTSTVLVNDMGSVWQDSGARLLQCTNLGQTECIQAFCERPCSISLSGSYDINILATLVDSGFDAGDAADSSDAGSPPTITQVTPNLLLATGNGGTGSSGQVITFTGTNLTSGTTYDIGSVSTGNAVTSCTGGTSCTATIPALPVSGSTVGNVFVVHTAAGSGSGPSTTTNSGTVSLPQSTITVASTTGFPNPAGLIAVTSASGPQPVVCTGANTGTTFTSCTGGTGALANGNAVVQQATAAWILPTNTNVAFFHRGDVGTTIATGVSTWADQSVAARNWTQSTGANQPVLTSNFNGTGIPYLAFNGTTDTMSNTNPITGSAATMCWVGNYTSLGTSQMPLSLSVNAGTEFVYFTSSSTWRLFDGTNLVNSSATGDTNPHVWCGRANGASSTINVDSTQNTGTLAVNLSGNNTLGSNNGSFFGTVNIEGDLGYVAAVSTGDLATILADEKVTGNTP